MVLQYSFFFFFFFFAFTYFLESIPLVGCTLYCPLHIHSVSVQLALKVDTIWPDVLPPEGFTQLAVLEYMARCHRSCVARALIGVTYSVLEE
jgi:hypothetical protein